MMILGKIGGVAERRVNCRVIDFKTPVGHAHYAHDIASTVGMCDAHGLRTQRDGIPMVSLAQMFELKTSTL